MENDLNEMKEEFLELHSKLEHARSKLFSAENAAHKAQGDVFDAMADVARLEQHRVFAMREMAKLAKHI